MTTRRAFLHTAAGLGAGVALLGGGRSVGAAPALVSRLGEPAARFDDQPLQANNLRLLAAHDLNGFGLMGEGIAIQQLANGRRVGYFANESGPMGMSVLDVTNPRNPGVLAQVPAENDHTRFNSLSMSGDILAVARQTADPGQNVAGLVVYDASDPEHLRQLSFFDTSGPYSRGAHFVWFVDGRYAWLSTGMPDFRPANPNDDQFLVIVDLQDPEQPVEAGRWWLPGMAEGEPPLPRLPRDSGYRMHNANVLPSNPDRAYLGWIDGGFVILDTSDISDPRLVANLDPYLNGGTGNGFAHTLVPHLGRNLLVGSEEAVTDACADHPKNIYTIDLTDEANPTIVAAVPLPDASAYCGRGGRFGSHNVHENHEQATAKELHNTVVGSFFNGGVRIYDIAEPARPREIAAYVPGKPPNSRSTAIQFNDVFVDEKGTLYAGDRLGGGVYVLEYTGSIPLT
jgi:hypothetical protein